MFQHPKRVEALPRCICSNLPMSEPALSSEARGILTPRFFAQSCEAGEGPQKKKRAPAAGNGFSWVAGNSAKAKARNDQRPKKLPFQSLTKYEPLMDSSVDCVMIGHQPLLKTHVYDYSWGLPSELQRSQKKTPTWLC